MNGSVEKGDIIALTGNRRVEVLSVRVDYEKPGQILRFDFIDRSEASPFRRVGYPSEILSILQKNQNKAPDPKAERSYDNAKADPQKVIIVDGKEYVPKNRDGNGKDPANVVNPDVGPQVHEAVKAPAKPVLTRGKTDKAK